MKSFTLIEVVIVIIIIGIISFPWYDYLSRHTGKGAAYGVAGPD
jgi:prepilin-type N-terminal cleavage/methylation domain-containing protein